MGFFEKEKVIFELSNEQRKYFALPDVEEVWQRVIVKPSPYDDFMTVTYLDGNYIISGLV